jgi:YegS/Rv2252/BmrU family lipid kinase
VLDPKRTVVIANPAAGAGRVGRERDAIVAALQGALGPCEVLFTKQSGDAVTLAAQAAAGGATTVLSLGGDGTHNEVVNGLLRSGDRTDVRMGVLSAGSGGDFCRLTVGGHDLKRGAAAIAESAARPEPPRIDIGRVHYRRDDGADESRCFLNIGSVGISGLVCRIVNASSKPLGGKVAYFTATVRALWQYQPPRLRIRVDSEVMLEAEITTLAICNGQYAGGGMHFAPRARLGDGQFDVVAIQPSSLWASMRDTRHLYGSRILELPYVSWHRGRRIQVEVLDEPRSGEPRSGRKAWVELDGEAPGFAPAEFELLPQALPLLGLRRDVLM